MNRRDLASAISLMRTIILLKRRMLSLISIQSVSKSSRPRRPQSPKSLRNLNLSPHGSNLDFVSRLPLSPKRMPIARPTRRSLLSALNEKPLPNKRGAVRLTGLRIAPKPRPVSWILAALPDKTATSSSNRTLLTRQDWI